MTDDTQPDYWMVGYERNKFRGDARKGAIESALFEGADSSAATPSPATYAGGDLSNSCTPPAPLYFSRDLAFPRFNSEDACIQVIA